MSTMSDFFTVQVYGLNGKWLGRLTPEGTATRKTIYAVMLPRDRAEDIAADINDGGSFRAKVKPF